MTEEQLGLAHYEDLLQLQECYPEEFRVVGDQLRKRLALLESTHPRLSWLLRASHGPSGYMVAYQGVSSIPSDVVEKVIVVDDLVTDPARQSDFFQLLRCLKASIEDNELDHLAIEADCRSGMYGLVSGHSRVLERLGYELVAEHPFWSQALGEQMTWIRLHPIHHPELVIADSTLWSPELREEQALRLRHWS